MKDILMNRILVAAAAFAFCLAASEARAAERYLVKDGEARAEIVIAEEPPRSVRLAAHELQTYVEKISGARLPIVTRPSEDAPVQVYVGRSPFTDRLNIRADDLQHGAYRIASGDDWLVLIGDDTDFEPIEPWARNNGDIVSGKLQREWETIAGAPWGAPHRTMYKHRIKLPGDLGKPDGAATEKNEALELWGFDERGSFNAVCGFLRSLGVRWYLPGELGEVTPSLPTIPLPGIDETVRPDFPLRRFNVRFGVVGRDTAMWAMRLGMRDPFDIQVAHGLATMTGRDEIFAAHPDWFALYGGKRHYQPGSSKNQLCYSNEELFQETVRYARAQLDHYQLETVSIMPPDGYTAICQCPLCEGKDMPERGGRGALSDYVWDFVNRVAKEVGKTHPDRKILNCAYGIYTLPPVKIEKLEPNVVVCIVGGRRPVSNKREQREEFRRLREAWAAKTDNPIMIFENYPFTARGWYLPAFVPHSLGESINETKGQSQGEDIWLSIGQDFDTTGIGFNHFLVYFTARMYWGGPQQDVDALFREYCRLFYGPAEQEMHAFFTYCEANWQEMEKDKSKGDRALALFAAAQSKAEPDSPYGRRLALIDDYLKGLRNKSVQLSRQRGPVPKLRLVGEARSRIVIDGKLEEAAWTDCPVASTGGLRELQTGRTPTFGTTAKAAWLGDSVYFAIRCDERPGEKLNVTSTRKDDSAIWYGDCIEVLLETESHSYYQIAVNPAGAVADLDRSAAKSGWFSWDAQAEVATHVADDHWIVEMRIPVTQDENDPLHQVIGRKPTQSLPWHINICRQRVRDTGTEHSAFSPTGAATFHDAMKFAYFYDGRSHQFEAAPPEDDFLAAYAAAANLARERKHAEAVTAFTALADRKITDLQKSMAFEQAAAAARAMEDEVLAAQLTERIPIEAVRKTVLMDTLLAERQAAELLAQFAEEDIAAWPFWQQGAGYFARGRAFAVAGAGKEAEADLSRALEFTGERRTRQSIWLALGENREQTLKDDERALAAYREVIGSTGALGGADEFRAVQAIARILTRLGRYDAALAALDRVETETLRGYWRGALLLSRGDTLHAANRNAEALTAYKAVISTPAIDPRHRQAAEEKAKTLNPNAP
jgi:tetratricopeptide (TPR) repeat protein